MFYNTVLTMFKVSDILIPFFDQLQTTLLEKVRGKCPYAYKGKKCGKTSLSNGYCNAHQKHYTTISNILEAANKKSLNDALKAGFKPTEIAKKRVKTDGKVQEWMKTAIPQDVTTVKKKVVDPCMKEGYLSAVPDIVLHHEETDFIFNEEFVLIGKLSGNHVIKLMSSDIAVAEWKGWQYDKTSVL